jgi:hypothetical protein
MSNDTTTTDQADTAALVGVGEACGVCRFPVAEDQICGNVVYAIAARGTLPKFCGAPGQAELQQRHGTPGNPEHKSELAGYPRKRLGMSSARAKELAERQAADLGIHHRAPVAPAARAEKPEPVAAQSIPAPAPAVEDHSTAPVDAAAEPRTDVQISLPAQESAARAIPSVGQADLARLAELLLAAGEVVGSLDQRLDVIRTAAETAVAKRTEMEMRAKKDAATAREKQAAAESAVAQAEEQLRLAREAQLHAEGRLAAAQARIEALEGQLSSIDERHRVELDRVRSDADARADARIDRIMRDQAERRSSAPVQAPPAADVPNLNIKQERVLAEVAARKYGVLQLTDPETDEARGSQLVNLSSGSKVTKDVSVTMTELGKLNLLTWGFSDDPVNQVRYTNAGPVALIRLTDLGVAASQHYAH